MSKLSNVYTVYADQNQEAKATGKDICIDTLNDGDAITFLFKKSHAFVVFSNTWSAFTENKL